MPMAARDSREIAPEHVAKPDQILLVGRDVVDVLPARRRNSQEAASASVLTVA